MIIKASTSIRNDYATIANLAKETKQPIYITKNGEGDSVLMSIDAFEAREQMLDLRESIIAAEAERLSGAQTYSISDVRQMLTERRSND